MRLAGLLVLALVVLVVPTCSESEMAEPPPPEISEGVAEEEGAPIVTRGEGGTFQAPSGSFALSVGGVSCETGDLLVQDIANDSLYDDRVYTPGQGQFCIVEMALRNVGRAPAYFQRVPRLITVDGTLYGDEEEVSSTVTTYRLGQVNELNPGTRATEFFVFDIPADREPDLLLVESPLPAAEPVLLSLR